MDVQIRWYEICIYTIRETDESKLDRNDNSCQIAQVLNLQLLNTRKIDEKKIDHSATTTTEELCKY